jgi:GT2 family glycosyltransferase
VADAGAIDRPAVSAVVVSWNSRDVLLGCLDSLADHRPAGGLEVVVVDNASSDGSAAAAGAHRVGARVIANQTNRGLAAANNQGMATANGDTFLICNPDVVVREGAVDALLAAFERHPRAGFAIPRLVHPDGAVQVAAGDLPTLRDALLGRQASRAGDRQGGFWWHGWAHDTERAIGHGGEACYLVRRTTVEEVGPQDEGFPLDWEGIDWSERVGRAGWEIWFCPSAEVLHLGGVSIRQAPARWVRQSHRGMYRYFAKRNPVWARPVLAVLFGARAAGKLVMVGVGARMYERAHRG